MLTHWWLSHSQALTRANFQINIKKKTLSEQSYTRYIPVIFCNVENMNYSVHTKEKIIITSLTLQSKLELYLQVGVTEIDTSCLRRGATQLQLRASHSHHRLKAHVYDAAERRAVWYVCPNTCSGPTPFQMLTLWLHICLIWRKGNFKLYKTSRRHGRLRPACPWHG